LSQKPPKPSSISPAVEAGSGTFSGGTNLDEIFIKAKAFAGYCQKKLAIAITFQSCLIIL
jgi:hypothetical protein